MGKFSDLDVCQRFVHKDKNKILAYISFLYDRDSDLNNIQHLDERKREACLRSKLDFDDPEVKSIMEMKNDQVNKLIFDYLSIFQNNNSYHKLCTDQQMFWDIQKILMTSPTTTDEDELMKKYKSRGELSKTSDDILSRINRLYNEIYLYDEVKEVAVSHVTQMLRPEQRVRMKENQ